MTMTKHFAEFVASDIEKIMTKPFVECVLFTVSILVNATTAIKDTVL